MIMLSLTEVVTPSVCSSLSPKLYRLSSDNLKSCSLRLVPTRLRIKVVTRSLNWALFATNVKLMMVDLSVTEDCNLTGYTSAENTAMKFAGTDLQ